MDLLGTVAGIGGAASIVIPAVDVVGRAACGTAAVLVLDAIAADLTEGLFFARDDLNFHRL